MTRDTKVHSKMWHAALAVAELHLQLTTVLAVRISAGAKELKPREEFAASLLVWWTHSRPTAWQTFESVGTGVDFEMTIGTGWQDASAVQFLLDTSEDEHAVM